MADKKFGEMGGGFETSILKEILEIKASVTSGTKDAVKQVKEAAVSGAQDIVEDVAKNIKTSSVKITDAFKDLADNVNKQAGKIKFTIDGKNVDVDFSKIDINDKKIQKQINDIFEDFTFTAGIEVDSKETETNLKNMFGLYVKYATKLQKLKEANPQSVVRKADNARAQLALIDGLKEIQRHIDAITGGVRKFELPEVKSTSLDILHERIRAERDQIKLSEINAKKIETEAKKIKQKNKELTEEVNLLREKAKLSGGDDASQPSRPKTVGGKKRKPKADSSVGSPDIVETPQNNTLKQLQRDAEAASKAFDKANNKLSEIIQAEKELDRQIADAKLVDYAEKIKNVEAARDAVLTALGGNYSKKSDHKANYENIIAIVQELIDNGSIFATRPSDLYSVDKYRSAIADYSKHTKEELDQMLGAVVREITRSTNDTIDTYKAWDANQGDDQGLIKKRRELAKEHEAASKAYNDAADAANLAHQKLSEAEASVSDKVDGVSNALITEQDVREAEENYDRLSTMLHHLGEEAVQAEISLAKLQKRAQFYGFGSDKSAVQEGRLQGVLSQPKDKQFPNYSRGQFVVDSLKKGRVPIQTPSGDYGLDNSAETGASTYLPTTKAEYEYAKYLYDKITEMNVGWGEGLKILQSQNGQLEAAQQRVDTLNAEYAKTKQEAEDAYDKQAQMHNLWSKQQRGGQNSANAEWEELKSDDELSKQSDAVVEGNKEKIESYIELSNVVSRYIELTKSLVDAESHTADHEQITGDMNQVRHADLSGDKQEYIDAINKQQKNIKKIKSAIKAGASTYTDEDGYVRDIVENTLVKAESTLRGYIYHYVEDFDDINALVEGAQTKSLKNLITKEVDRFKSDEAIQRQQEEIAEAANAAALAEMERIEDVIKSNAPEEQVGKVGGILRELKYDIGRVDDYTQMSVTDRIANHIGVESPRKEIENNAKAIKSYEELCEVVARYNELQQRRWIYTGGEKGLTEAEENEFAALTGRLENTKPGANPKSIQSPFDGYTNVEKLAELLGIEIPQATQKAEEQEDVSQTIQNQKKQTQDIVQLVDNYGDSLDEVNNKLMQGTKFLDEQGRIIRLFHNSNEVFDRFDPSKSGGSQGVGTLGKGNYLHFGNGGKFDDPKYGRYQTQWYANIDKVFDAENDELSPEQINGVLDKFLPGLSESDKKNYINKFGKKYTVQAIKYVAQKANAEVLDVWKYLGYDAAKRGDEINIFDASKIHRANDNVLDMENANKSKFARTINGKSGKFKAKNPKTYETDSGQMSMLPAIEDEVDAKNKLVEANNKVAESQKKVNEAGQGVQMTIDDIVPASADESAPKIEDEAKALDKVGAAAEKAAKSKKKFAGANKEVANSADTSEGALEGEKKALDKVGETSKKVSQTVAKDFNQVTLDTKFSTRDYERLYDEMEAFAEQRKAENGYDLSRVSVNTDAHGNPLGATIAYYKKATKESIVETFKLDKAAQEAENSVNRLILSSRKASVGLADFEKATLGAINKQDQLITQKNKTISTLSGALDPNANRTLFGTDYEEEARGKIQAIKDEVAKLDQVINGERVILSEKDFLATKRRIAELTQEARDFINQSKNAEYAPTQLESHSVSSGNQYRKDQLEAYVNDWNRAGIYVGDLKAKAEELGQSVAKITKHEDLKRYLEGMREARALAKLATQDKKAEEERQAALNAEYQEYIDLINKLNAVRVDMSKLDPQKNRDELIALRAYHDSLERKFSSKFGDFATRDDVRARFTPEELVNADGEDRYKIGVKAGKISDKKRLEEEAAAQKKVNEAYKEYVQLMKELTQIAVKSLDLDINKDAPIIEGLNVRSDQIKRRLNELYNEIFSVPAEYSAVAYEDILKLQDEFTRKVSEKRSEIAKKAQEKADAPYLNYGKTTANAALRKQSNLQGAIESLDIVDDKALAQINDYNKKVKEVVDLREQFASDPGAANNETLVKNFQKASYEADQLYKSIKAVIDEEQKMIQTSESQGFQPLELSADQIANLESTMRSFAQAGAKGRVEIKGWNSDNTKMYYSVTDSDGAVQEMTMSFGQYTHQLTKVRTATKETGSLMEQIFKGIKVKAKELISYVIGGGSVYKIIEMLRQGIQYVREIDLALTELKKVTDETEESYDKFLKTAAKTGARLGSTISAVTEATATFAKLGYTIEQASEMAEAAIVYKNVGDNIASTEDAADSIISTMKGFGLEATESMAIVDKFNEVGE